MWGPQTFHGDSSAARVENLSDYYYYAYFDSTNIFTRTLLKTAIWECVNAPDPKGIYYTVV